MITFDNYQEPRYSVNAGKGVIIGKTDVMLNLFKYLNHLADLPTTVLLMGETGTGKELCAKALHYNGKGERKKFNFVAVNCAGIPSELLEGELFGYVRGAFTGAYSNTSGKFQHADEGTIFLDEIGDMSPHLQAKILRVLQEREITRVGSNKVEKINARVIAATNKRLEEEVKKGRFRQDLYYRLNVFPISIPPLRERREDIPLIAQYFIAKYNEQYNSSIQGLSPEAEEKLRGCEWKGNVRELENIIERIFVLKKEGMIEASDLEKDASKKIVLVHQESKPIVQDLAPSVRPESQKLWYEKGVLPITLNSLCELDGVKTVSTIYNVVGQKGKPIYVDNASGKKSGCIVIYLTPGNLHLFFNDTSTEDYRALEKRIIEGPFNEIAKRPFEILSIKGMIRNKNIIKDGKKIKDIIDKLKPYKIIGGLSTYIALTEDNADYFAGYDSQGKKIRSEQKLEKLKEEIRESYERFKSWKPD